MGQADPILTRLGASTSVKKCVETAIGLSSSTDAQQRNLAYSFMESAIKELEDQENRGADAGLGPSVDDGINAPKLHEEEEDDKEKKLHEEEDDDKEKKLHEEHEDKDEHKLHEEELSNHNRGQRTTGSEQSTDNVAPYPGEGVDTTNGEKPMQDMDGTVNQWSETNGVVVPGLPPTEMGMNGMPPNGAPPNGAPPNGLPNGGQMMPGLAPDIAQEMGMNMPPPPDMNTNQMMRQMQYTINYAISNNNRKFLEPMSRIMKTQKESIDEQKRAIRKLSLELRETKVTNGSMKLDLDTMRQNATATFRETTSTPILENFPDNGIYQGGRVSALQPLPNYQRVKVDIARSEIEQMDKILNSNKNPMYN